MEIWFYGAAEYLPGEKRSEVRSLTAWGPEPRFWVAHSAGSDPQSFFQENETMLRACLETGGAILFVSGSAFGGVTETEAKELEQETKKRIHCLSVPCTGAVVERIRKFLLLVEDLRPGDDIPWSEAEPPSWPQSLVAVYLMLKAMDYSPGDAGVIRRGWEAMDSRWRRQLWDDAWAEYQERGSPEDEWLAGGLPGPNSSNDDLPAPEMITKATETLRTALSLER